MIEAFKRTHRIGSRAPQRPRRTITPNSAITAEFLGRDVADKRCSRRTSCTTAAKRQTWRLKGHAEDEFWRWVCSWAIAIRSPSDLGYEDARYRLPPLEIESHTVKSDAAMVKRAGTLFAMPARTLQEQRAAKRASLTERVRGVVETVRAEQDQQWLVWCELNDESSALAAEIPGAVEVKGSDTPRQKADAMLAFARGDVHVLVSKPSICGFGMNWQNCARQAFVGVTHSYEQFYQAVRRSWRFGQTRPVRVHVFASELESAVVASLKRKEADAARMVAAMISAMRETQIANVRSLGREVVAYSPRVEMQVPAWIRSEAA
jgi:hypothetical protein